MQKLVGEVWQNLGYWLEIVIAHIN